MTLEIFVWLCQRRGWNFSIDQGQFFVFGSFLVFGVAVWIVKRYLVGGNLMYLAGSAAVLFGLVFWSGITWLLRKKIEVLICVIQEHISPLVWLFSFLLILSVPIVGYNVFRDPSDSVMRRQHTFPHGSGKDRPNIILITFDALTARNMSVYGYERPTTPFIENWAKEASLFTSLEAGSNITTPTTASLMTGKRVWTHQTYHLAGSLPKSVRTENLPLLLQKYGYRTMAFVVNPFASVKTLGLENNFEMAPLPTQLHGPVSLLGDFDRYLYEVFGDRIRLHDWIIQRDFVPYRLLLALFGDHFTTSCPPENAFNKFLWAMDEGYPGPFFSWIHLYPPHDPYLPPKPFIGTFDASSELRSYKSQLNVKNAALRYRDTFRDFPPKVKPIIQILRNRYDEFIRYCDDSFEYLISQLKDRDMLNNTVIILSSDHGESFEHGAIQHSGLHLYEQVTHIPLIIKAPRQAKGRAINDVVEQIDIPPTILELADIPAPKWMEGRSLVPLMRGEAVHAKPAFSMSLENNMSEEHKIDKGTIAAWEGGYKLIHYMDRNLSLLFNLDADPDELNNVWEQEPEKGQHLLKLIRENLDRANMRIVGGDLQRLN
ncbi:MAG: sulfatase [Nitrospirota bacterium]